MALHVGSTSSPIPRESGLTLEGRVTCGFVNAGGVVPEKFNAVEASANIDAEYGNQVRACLLSLLSVTLY